MHENITDRRLNDEKLVPEKQMHMISWREDYRHQQEQIMSEATDEKVLEEANRLIMPTLITPSSHPALKSSSEITREAAMKEALERGLPLIFVDGKGDTSSAEMMGLIISLKQQTEKDDETSE